MVQMGKLRQGAVTSRREQVPGSLWMGCYQPLRYHQMPWSSLSSAPGAGVPAWGWHLSPETCWRWVQHPCSEVQLWSLLHLS